MFIQKIVVFGRNSVNHFFARPCKEIYMKKSPIHSLVQWNGRVNFYTCPKRHHKNLYIGIAYSILRLHTFFRIVHIHSLFSDQSSKNNPQLLKIKTRSRNISWSDISPTRACSIFKKFSLKRTNLKIFVNLWINWMWKSIAGIRA